MADIRLNEVLIDYLTVTSFSRIWFNYMIESFADDVDETVEKKAGSYKGKSVLMLSGSITFLEGAVDGKEHFIVRFSGQLSNWVIAEVLRVSKGFDVQCSRLDVQVTVMKPVRMSMRALRDRLEKSGHRVGYPTPEVLDGVKIETVYVGTREKSDRFYRFYMKALLGGGHVVRFEAELKKRRSRAIFSEWMTNGFDGSQLNYEVEKMARLDGVINRLLLPLSGESERVIVKTVQGKTVRWLINDIMPVMKRVLCAHEEGHESVYSAIMDTLEAYNESK